MPLTELHKLAESDLIDQHNIKLHFKDINTVNEVPNCLYIHIINYIHTNISYSLFLLWLSHPYIIHYY